MSEDELRGAVDTFLDGADTVYDEYEQGYVDADAALGMLEDQIEALQSAAEDE